MADRTYIYCPVCAANGNKSEVYRETFKFFCPVGHQFSYDQLMAAKPEMIKKEIQFKPGDNDVKTEFWCNGEVLSRSRETLGDRIHKTLESVLRAAMAGEFILIDGQQAEELKKLGIRSGAEMLVAAKQNLELAAENESLVAQVNRWEERIAAAMGNGG